MQDFLLEFSSRTNNQIEMFRSEQSRNNSLLKADITTLQKGIDNSINDCTKNTSNELTYTNKVFNTQIAESETKLLNQNNQLLNLLIEISNKNNFQFESVKETCIVQSNNMKSLINTLQNIINSSFYDLENSNRQGLEVIGNNLSRLMDSVNTQKDKFEKDTTPTNPTPTQKSFKIIKSYFDQQKAGTVEERIQGLDIKLNSLIAMFKENKKREKTEQEPRTSKDN